MMMMSVLDCNGIGIKARRKNPVKESMNVAGRVGNPSSFWNGRRRRRRRRRKRRRRK